MGLGLGLGLGSQDMGSAGEITQVFHFDGNDEYIASGAALTALTASDDYMVETYLWIPASPSDGGLWGSFNGTDGLLCQISSGDLNFQWRGGTTRRHNIILDDQVTFGQYNHIIIYIPNGTNEAGDWDIYVNGSTVTKTLSDNDNRVDETSLVMDLGRRGSNATYTESRIAYHRVVKGSFTIDQAFVDGRDPLTIPPTDDVSGLTGTNLLIVANDATWDGDSITGAGRLDTGTFDSTNMVEADLESFDISV